MYQVLNKVMMEMGLNLAAETMDLQQVLNVMEVMNDLLEDARNDLKGVTASFAVAHTLPRLTEMYTAMAQLEELKRILSSPKVVIRGYDFRDGELVNMLVDTFYADTAVFGFPSPYGMNLYLQTVQKAVAERAPQIFEKYPSIYKIGWTIGDNDDTVDWILRYPEKEDKPVVDAGELLADYGRWVGSTVTTKETNPFDITPKSYIHEILAMAYTPPRTAVEEFLSNFYSGTEVLAIVSEIAWE